MARIVALTGTPGTGKTAVAKALADRIEGLRVISVNAFAAEHGLVEEGGDVDVRDLDDLLRNELTDADGTVVLEGHLSHHLSFLDGIVVLRCRPRVLVDRLRERGWDEAKVRENAEAEALGVVSAEADAEGRAGWAVELETSDADVQATADRVAAILADPQAERFKSLELGWVDHLEEVLDWY